MSAEQTVKDKTVQPNGCLSFLKQAAAWVLALAALAGIFIAGTMYSDVAQSLSSEPVYEATPEQVNPALEGKLVKMRVTELVAEGGPLTDETFGLRKENTIALHRYYLPLRKGRINVSYRELHGIRESWVLAPRVKAGAYTLRARKIFWKNLGGECLNPDEMTLPAAWEGRVVSRTAHGITLRTDDTSNLAVPNADFRYMRIPSPWRGVRHMVGRQQGNVLDLTGEGCGLIRGEEQYQQWSRMRPAVGLLLMPVWEYCFYILFLQGAITLCLLPGVLLMQKRGWVRATYVSILLGVLLTALVASAFWLLPYSEYNWMTWIYTLVPGLIAFVLLGLVYRKKILNFVLKYIHKMTMPPFHNILATTALCLAAVGVSSCTTPQALSAKKSLPECYLTYSDGYPWSSEPPPVLRLNEQECRELLAIEAETEPDTPMYDWQTGGGSPEFYIFPKGQKARLLFALNKVKHLTHTYIPESAAKRFDALVQAVESRPESRLTQAETQRWHKQHFPHFMYRLYYKD